MKFIFLVLVSCLLSVTVLAEDQPVLLLNGEVEVHKIGPDTYVAVDKTYFNSNVLVAKMSDGAVFVASSPFESQGTQALVDWIKKELKPQKMVAVNTHFHLDGSGGNQVYKKEGFEIWASDLTQKLQKTRGKKMPQSAAGMALLKDPSAKERLRKLQIIPAEHIFPLKKGKSFQFGNENVEVYFPGEAHSRDNVVVYFGKRKVLFGGCMIKPGEGLGNLSDANVKAWARSARSLNKFDPLLVVPGHDPWGGPELIGKTIANALKASR